MEEDENIVLKWKHWMNFHFVDLFFVLTVKKCLQVVNRKVVTAIMPIITVMEVVSTVYQQKRSNSVLIEDLEEFVPKITNQEILKQLILESHGQQNPLLLENSDKKKILNDIKDYEERLSHCRDLLATKQIDADDYREMKTKYSATISQLEAQLIEAGSEGEDTTTMISLGVDRLVEIRKELNSGSLSGIRKTFGSMYPEKTCFQNEKLRTARRNNFVERINLINRNL